MSSTSLVIDSNGPANLSYALLTIVNSLSRSSYVLSSHCSHSLLAIFHALYLSTIERGLLSSITPNAQYNGSNTKSKDLLLLLWQNRPYRHLPSSQQLHRSPSPSTTNCPYYVPETPTMLFPPVQVYSCDYPSLLTSKDCTTVIFLSRSSIVLYSPTFMLSSFSNIKRTHLE